MMRFTKIILAVASLALAFGYTASTALAEDAMPKHCVVNGDEFAERKNPPIEVKHNDETIKVCCKKCVRKFQKDPEKYVKKYKEALKSDAAATAPKGDTAAAPAKAEGSCCSGH